MPPHLLSQEERQVRSQNLLDQVRSRLLRTYFPLEDLVSGEEDQYLETWSEGNNILLRSLRTLLPFSQHLRRADLDHFVDHTLEPIVEASLRQIAYLQLAGIVNSTNAPIEIIYLTENEDHFWLRYVPENSRRIRELIYEGEHVYYLHSLLISYQGLEIQFNEVRVTTQNSSGQPQFPIATNPPRFVYTEGRTYAYSWITGNWGETEVNPDDRLINPGTFTNPPLVPQSIAFAFRNITPPIEDTSGPPESTDNLPPSSPQSTASGWSDQPEPWNPHLLRCWCEREVCSCGFRPDTPPTPPGIELWRPGQSVLPSIFGRRPPSPL